MPEREDDADLRRRLDAARRDAEDARGLLDNPMLARCLDAIRQEALRDFEESAPGAAEERERAHQLLLAVRRLDAKIKGFAAADEFAERSARSRLRRQRGEG